MDEGTLGMTPIWFEIKGLPGTGLYVSVDQHLPEEVLIMLASNLGSIPKQIIYNLVGQNVTKSGLPNWIPRFMVSLAAIMEIPSLFIN